jgi:hypothetical protein
MDRVNDEPIRFYFEHRELIEQWAALEKPAREVVREILRDIAVRISDEAPADARVFSGDDGGYTMVAYWRQAWSGDDGRPRLAIGIAWPPSRVSLHPGTGERPWVGIWRGQTTKDDPLVAAVRGRLASEPFSIATSWTWWPLYRYLEPPSGPFWDDLEPWNQAVVDCVHDTWNRFADCVDSALLLVGRGRRDEAGVVTTDEPPTASP